MTAILFIDIKEVFDNILKEQLFHQIIKLGVDNELIAWISSFLLDSKVQLVIKREILRPEFPKIL